MFYRRFYRARFHWPFSNTRQLNRIEWMLDRNHQQGYLIMSAISNLSDKLDKIFAAILAALKAKDDEREFAIATAVAAAVAERDLQIADLTLKVEAFEAGLGGFSPSGN